MKIYKWYLIFLIILIIGLYFVKEIFLNKKMDEVKLEGSKIKVYLHELDEVVDMDLEEYVVGVVGAEMPASFEMEALKAQFISARTYSIRNIQNKQSLKSEIHKGADICTNHQHCQAWKSSETLLNNWGNKNGNKYLEKLYTASKETANLVIEYNDELINPLYHANSGGRTENNEEVWGGEALPYLVSVESPEDESSSSFSSEKSINIDELIMKLKEKVPQYNFDTEDILNMNIREKTVGNRVKILHIGDIDFKGTDIRSMLELKSTNFDFQIQGNTVLFKVKGYGHGVGMSQNGANYMAKQGCDYIEILKYYYKGIEIKNKKP